MVDFQYAELFEKDSVDKQIRISYDSGTITNSELHQGQFELTESLCSEDQLRFGTCEASQVKFTISNVFLPMAGKQITISDILEEHIDVPFIFGKYKVYSDKPTADRSRRDIVAYDSLYDILTAEVSAWYNEILPNADSTVTLKQFRYIFFQHLGIEQEEVELVNDSMTVTKTIEPSQLSGKTVITAICEINGCFGHMGRDGRFQYVFLQEINETDPANAEEVSNYISAEYEDFVTARINKLLIRKEENDIGANYPEGNLSESDNCYIVQDNFLLYGKSTAELTEIAKNMYSVISKVWYRPAKVEAKGNPCLEVGDGIKLSTKNAIVYTYILKRTLKGIQALKDTYEAEGKQYQSEKVTSIREDIIQLKGKTNKLNRSIEETKSQIDNVEEGLHSEIVQTASEFDVKIEQMQKEIDKEIQVYNLPYDPTLTNYPAWDWTYNIPCNNTVRLRDDLAFEYKDEWWAKNARTIVYNLETNITYRFQKKDGAYGWFPTGDTEYSYLLKQMAEFNVKVDGISASVSSLSQSVANDYIKTVDAKSLISQTSKEIMLSVSTDYVTKKTAEGYETKEHAESTIKLTSDAITAEVNRAKGEEGSLSSRITQTAESISSEVTRAQGAESSLSSKIEQTASSIRQEVSAGYATKASLELKIDKSDNGQIISMINASANEINLKGNRISIVSDYFTLEHSGRITAVSGNIGGWDIASNGIVKESQYGKVLLQADGTLAMIDKSNNVKWALQCDGNFNLPGTASVGSVEALSARIGTIEANYITAGTVAANYATIGSLNATNAVVSGKLSTSNLYSEIANLDFISVKGLWHAGHHISPLSISVNGVIRKVLAYDQ